ncbi:hypothetical protein [Acidithiobacillus ferrooxidans]|uniref:hypothetical protein n=1 Tax=Acidithiobacillus ferrooxidans TaxID=920 RepID=UPI000AF7CDC0|nr:hypothetical protein [Acidithiobacillus ferrooxidans]
MWTEKKRTVVTNQVIQGLGHVQIKAEVSSGRAALRINDMSSEFPNRVEARRAMDSALAEHVERGVAR